MTNISDPIKSIPEDFLQYVWRYSIFQSRQLTTTAQQSLTILHPGQQNFGGGPDFLNAKLRIGETTWIGHVEIHIRSSDWHRHGHTEDEHYKNVILHAVLHHDSEIYLRVPGDLAVFEMKNQIPQTQLQQYKHWLTSRSWISCERHLQDSSSLVWTAWKDRMLIDRLEKKSEAILKIHASTGGDWSETFYRVLARNFGFKANADAMEALAAIMPYRIIQRHRTDPFQVMALLYGQAGMLNEIFTDEFPRALQTEYYYLQKKYKLSPMNATIWNFGRLRPSNFPGIRISQFSDVLCRHEHLLSHLLNQPDMEALRKIFIGEAHAYWNQHYRFDTHAEANKQIRAKKTGNETVDNVLINTVAVFLFTFGRQKERNDLVEKSLKILETCKAEDNQIIRKWTSLGIHSKHAADSQSLIQLYGVYCTARRCLQCAIGVQLLKQK